MVRVSQYVGSGANAIVTFGHLTAEHNGSYRFPHTDTLARRKPTSILS
jgi:hypothetical protein